MQVHHAIFQTWSLVSAHCFPANPSRRRPLFVFDAVCQSRSVPFLKQPRNSPARQLHLQLMVALTCGEEAPGAAMEGTDSAVSCKHPLRRRRTGLVFNLIILAAVAAGALLFIGSRTGAGHACSIAHPAVPLASTSANGAAAGGTANSMLSHAMPMRPVARGRTLVLYVYGGADPGELVPLLVLSHGVSVKRSGAERACMLSPQGGGCCSARRCGLLLPAACRRSALHSACRTPLSVQSILRTSVSSSKRRSGQVGRRARTAGSALPRRRWILHQHPPDAALCALTAGR